MAYQFKREPLLAEEADALCNACETVKEKLLIFTLLDTGLRIAELCSLTDKSILYQQKALVVNGKGGMHGSMTKKRMVPLSPRVYQLLTNYFALHPKWFCGVRQCQEILKRVSNAAKLTSKCSPHVLRHTFAVNALSKNISLGALKKLMGHDSIRTTEVYLNIRDVNLLEEFHRKW